MDIVTNEKKWVESVLSSHELGVNPMLTLDRIARYYYQYGGYSKKEIPVLLEKFLIRCNPNVSLVQWADQVEKEARSADRRPLIELNGISISSTELAAIERLPGVRHRRLLFTLVCLAKYENFVRQNNSNWVKTEHKHIMSLANIVASSSVQIQILRDLRDAGLIAFSKRVDNLNIRVCCLDDGECELFISDFRNLGNQYMMYRGGPYMQCEECDLTIRRKSNSQRYCTSCAGDMYLKQSAESVMRHRVSSLYKEIVN